MTENKQSMLYVSIVAVVAIVAIVVLMQSTPASDSSVMYSPAMQAANGNFVGGAVSICEDNAIYQASRTCMDYHEDMGVEYWSCYKYMVNGHMGVCDAYEK